MEARRLPAIPVGHKRPENRIFIRIFFDEYSNGDKEVFIDRASNYTKPQFLWLVPTPEELTTIKELFSKFIPDFSGCETIVIE